MVSGKKPTSEDIVMYGRYYEHFIMKPVCFPVLFDIVMRVPPQVNPTRYYKGNDYYNVSKT